MARKTTTFPKKADDPLVQGAKYRFDDGDRAFIDDQIRALMLWALTTGPFSPGGDLGGSSGNQLVQRATGTGGAFGIGPSKTTDGADTNRPNENDSYYQRLSGAQTITLVTLSLNDLFSENIFVNVEFATSTMSSACNGSLGPALYRRSGGNVQTEISATWTPKGGGLAGCSATMTASGTTVVIAVTVPSGTTDVWVKWSRLRQTALTTPSISSVSPSHGLSTATTSITISGANLATTTGVTINGVPCTSVAASSGSVTCVTPTGTVGAQALVLTAGTGTASSTFTYDDALAPTLSSITPTHGTAGVRVDLVGTNLTGHTAVTINGITCTSIVEDSSTAAHCNVPTGSGAQTLTYTTAHGSATIAFTYDATAFDASAVYGGNLTHWSRDDSFTVTGSRCTQITDKSSNAKSFDQPTANFQALYAATDANGNGDLAFGPTAGLSSNPTRYGESTVVSLADLVATGTAFNVTLVIRPHAAAHNDVSNPLNGDALAGDSTGNYFGICLHNRGGAGNLTLVAASFTSAYHTTPDALVSIDNWHVVGVRYDGTNLFVNIDGTETTGVATAAPAVRTGQVKVGWVGLTGRYPDFKLAEMVWAKSDLGATNYGTQVMTPLKAKYGVP